MEGPRKPVRFKGWDDVPETADEEASEVDEDREDEDVEPEL